MMPMSLADLQDDEDKSSLESGQVSPEAFDAREEAPVQGGANSHHRHNASAGAGPQSGRKDQSY